MTSTEPTAPALCPAQAGAPGTLRQYYYCSRPAGHDGRHEAQAPNGMVVKRWPVVSDVT